MLTLGIRGHHSYNLDLNQLVPAQFVTSESESGLPPLTPVDALQSSSTATEDPSLPIEVPFSPADGPTGAARMPEPSGGPWVAPLHMARSTSRRVLKVGFMVVVAAVVCSATLILAATPAASPPPQPPPVLNPKAPGIVVMGAGPIDLPDPMFLAVGRSYHVYLSTAFADQTRANVPEMTGSPPSWGPVTDALPDLPAWARPASRGGKTWDPYVQRIGGAYLLYYSATLRAVRRPTHCLGVARSAGPSGPFVPVGGHPLVCQLSLGGDIDVQPFYDPNGPEGLQHPWYLIWKSDNNNLRPQKRTAIWAAPLSNNGLAFSGPATVIFHAEHTWQTPVLEAPQMVKSPDGRIWLFFSSGTSFYTARYSMGVAGCAGPLGPCHTFGPGPLVVTNSQGAGPGEETAFVAPDQSYWLLYSPWHTGIPLAPLRPVEGVRIGWNYAGPYLAEAGRFPLPPPPPPPPKAWPRPRPWLRNFR
jgi:Glycosyl hydrolases family 43